MRYGLHQDQFRSWIQAQGEPAFRADQLFHGLIQQHEPLENISTLPKAIRTRFGHDFPLALTSVREQVASDGTKKWLFTIAGGSAIETVLMPTETRATVCVSTQAGCAMACTFCATGQAGFERHLTVAEILEQIARAAQAHAHPITNVVFMGMGEPLANYDRLVESLQLLCHEWAISARSLTVSTVGLPPAMRRLAQDAPPVTLAVSLHAATDEARDALIPMNRRHPIREVLDAAADFSHARGRRVTFEITVIADTNDAPRDAHAFGALLQAFPGAGGAHVNLIPLNPTGAYSGAAPDNYRLSEMAVIIRSYGVTVTVRKPRGRDIAAACGQLRTDNL